jgi:pyridoxal phosphate enzyme (YggS family)
MMSRQAELAEALRRTHSRIDKICLDAGRSPDDISVIVVTKTWPVADIKILAELGVQDFGENKAQELRDKVRECRGLSSVWHFIGQLQTNKAAVVARNADVVHSVDRTRLVEALSRSAQERDTGSPLECFIQVSLDREPGLGRGGVAPMDVSMIAEQIVQAPALRLCGVMGVAPLGEAARPAFSRLRDVSLKLRENYPDATWISAGMSDDLEDAIHEGATHLRVGSAILGSRAALR